MNTSELEALRRHGVGVAYRMLGSVAEAEDVAQEALLRLTRQQGGAIDRPAAWTSSEPSSTRTSASRRRAPRSRARGSRSEASLHARGAGMPVDVDATLRRVRDELEIEAVAAADHHQLGMTWNRMAMIRTPSNLTVKGRLVRDA